jgi:hypothetical protein
MGQTNAARRLHDILEEALRIGNREQLIYQVLAVPLSISAPDENQYRFLDFFYLMSEVERLINQLKKVSNLEKYVKIVNNLQSLFFTYGIFQGKWGSIEGAIQSNNTLLILNSCADFIAREKLEISLEQERLQEFLQQCEDLLTEIDSSDFPEDIKTFLVIRLEEICTAIRHYKIGGPERLRMVVESSIGAIVLRHESLELDPSTKPLMNKIFGWLIGFGGVLDLAANTQGYLIPKVVELLGFAQHLLPPG